MWHTSVGKWLSGRFFFFRLFLSEVRSSRQILITYFFFFFFFFLVFLGPRRRRRQGVIGAPGVTGAVRRRQGVIGATAPLAPSGAVRRLQAPQGSKGVAPPGAVRRHQAGAFSFGLLQAPSALRPLLASEIPEHLS